MGIDAGGSPRQYLRASTSAPVPRARLNALRAFSKLVMALLAAIAVTFIRTGIMEILQSGH